MKTGDLQKAFGVGVTTIKNWVDEFGDFLSDGAKAESTRHRYFNESDYLVMATIAQLSQRDKLPYKVIHDRLKEGYRVEDTSAATIGYEDGRLVPAAMVEQVIDASEIKAELEAIRLDRDRLAEMLEKRDQQLAEKDARISQLQDRIAELSERAGKAEGRLEQIEQLQRQIEELKAQLEKRRRWFGG
jgi:DNA repair exonuclease SbcCD ATPase subunit